MFSVLTTSSSNQAPGTANHQYEQVPHCDSDDDLRGISNHSNPSTNSTRNTAVSITEMLRQTAARRMRQIEDTLLNDNRRSQSNHQNDAIVPMEDEHIIDLEDPNGLHHETSRLIVPNYQKQGTQPLHSVEMSDMNLNETHAPSDDEEEESYDDFVFLLFLDGTKRRAGVLEQWTVCHFKDRHFKEERDDGKKVRLIYRGKLLVDSAMMNSYHIPTDGFIHVSISKNGNLYRHTHRNGENGDAENGRDPNYEDFDDGMDDEAVARRLQRQEMEMGGFVGPYNPMFDGMRMRPLGASFGRRDAEHDPNEDPEIRRIRERKEFLCGMFLGSVAGIWILVFLILSSRQGNYSRRFRLGITVGVAINLMVQLTFHDPVVPPDPDAADPTAAAEADGEGVASNIDPVVEGENSAAI